MRAALFLALFASAAAFSAPSMAGLKLRQSKTGLYIIEIMHFYQASAKISFSCRDFQLSLFFDYLIQILFCLQTAVSMKAEGPLARLPAGVAKALAPAIAFASIAAPAFAEGTGEVLTCAVVCWKSYMLKYSSFQALGLDDTRLVVPLILIPVIIGILFQGFASEQVPSNLLGLLMVSVMVTRYVCRTTPISSTLMTSAASKLHVDYVCLPRLGPANEA